MEHGVKRKKKVEAPTVLSREERETSGGGKFETKVVAHFSRVCCWYRKNAKASQYSKARCKVLVVERASSLLDYPTGIHIMFS